VLCLTFRRKSSGFDRKADFKSDFKEEQRSDKHRKSETEENRKCARPCTARHGCAAVAEATHGRGCDHVPTHARLCVSPGPRDFVIFRLFNAVLFSDLGGDFLGFFWAAF